MGDYDSDDKYDRARRKKSKKSARSRSGSDDSRHSRKSKSKRRRSSSRKRHRSRSNSRDNHKSRSRRSRSHSRSRYRSHSRGRRRSRDRSYMYRRSHSRSRGRSRSDSRSMYDRSGSRDRRRRRRSQSSSPASSGDCSTSRPGIEKSFADMTPSEQNQARMQLAIEKAKAADEAIRQRHGIDDEEPADTKKRQQAIADIESEGFSQQNFTSNRYTAKQNGKKANEFSFGTSLDYVKSNNSGDGDADSIMHSRFSEDEAVRKERWLEILKKLRIQFMDSQPYKTMS
ncbi:hypothetical protein EB796_023099 [Bugula neritina]|uniref:Uncharacterized protein n=1 Tax=Bugula neritina TaxID=10212 RepID=A0A7J7IXL5_BUGNE|nr:hypothetical protein EB796_023099 [Bugula neritina]